MRSLSSTLSANLLVATLILPLATVHALGPSDYTALPPVDLPISAAQPVGLVGDWNNDGFDDLMIYDGAVGSFPVEVTVLTSTSQMTYGVAGTESLAFVPAPLATELNDVPGEELPGYPFQHSARIAVSTLNGDGFGDFFSTFAVSTVSTSQGTPAIFVGDLDGDGDMDLFGSADGITFTSFLNNGAGLFTSDNFAYTAVGGILVAQSAPGASPRVVNVYQQVVFDDQGQPVGVRNELITAARGTNQWAYETLLATTTTTGAINVFPVISADLNGNGLQDVIAVDQGAAVGFLAAADGSFSPARKIALSGLSGSILNAGDLDWDGDDDLLQFVGNDSFAVENQGNGSFNAFPLTAGGAPFAISGVGNFAGSNHPDLFRLTPNGATTRLTVLRYGLLASPQEIRDALSGVTRPSNPLALDRNGDGLLDAADLVKSLL